MGGTGCALRVRLPNRLRVATVSVWLPSRIADAPE